MIPVTSKQIDRLLNRFNVNSCSGCWEFMGRRYEFGSGKLTLYGSDGIYRSVLVHRLMYELAYGEIPEGKLVLHKCDNPPCGNPEHLFIGTQLDNVRNMISKGRGYDHHKRHYSPKFLSDYEVADIRWLASAGDVTQQEIAYAYNVSGAQISRIINKKRCMYIYLGK